MLVAAAMIAAFAGCGNGAGNNDSTGGWDEHKTGSMELGYATQFHVDYYEDDISVVRIEDGLECEILQ